MAHKGFIHSVSIAMTHPAGLFSAGNTALAIGQAEPVGIILNFGITAVIFGSRFIEIFTSRTLGIPFIIGAAINFFTAFSIEFNKGLGGSGGHLFAEGLTSLSLPTVSHALSMFAIGNLLSFNPVVLSGHVSAFAFVAWGIGHLYAGWHDKKGTIAKHIKENPQIYYGIGDMAAVNASGNLNPFSFPFMLLGFSKSVFIGRSLRIANNKTGVFIQKELTAARIYGIGYIVGALTSLPVLNFTIAQLLWAAAYFSFNKDT